MIRYGWDIHRRKRRSAYMKSQERRKVPSLRDVTIEKITPSTLPGKSLVHLKDTLMHEADYREQKLCFPEAGFSGFYIDSKGIMWGWVRWYPFPMPDASLRQYLPKLEMEAQSSSGCSEQTSTEKAPDER